MLKDILSESRIPAEELQQNKEQLGKVLITLRELCMFSFMYSLVSVLQTS